MADVDQEIDRVIDAAEQALAKIVRQGAGAAAQVLDSVAAMHSRLESASFSPQASRAAPLAPRPGEIDYQDAGPSERYTGDDTHFHDTFAQEGFGTADASIYNILDVRDKGCLVTWSYPMRSTLKYGDEIHVGDLIDRTTVGGDKSLKGIVAMVSDEGGKKKVTFRVVRM